MTKVRKQKKKKKFHYKNPKRTKKNKLPQIQSKLIRETWNNKTSSQKNMKIMGLVYDVNSDVRDDGTTNKVPTENAQAIQVNLNIINELETDANALREKAYRLPKNQVEYITYLLDKYGEDYKAMVKDKRNHLQQTWRQLRSKINVFKSIPEQYNEYLKLKTM